MRISALALAACLAVAPSAAFADTVLVVVAADNGIYEDPVRTEVERLVSESGATVRPFGEAVVDAGINPSQVLLCVDKAPDCMQQAAGEAKAERLLVFQLKSEATDAAAGPRVVMTGWAFDMESGERMRGAQRFCESCTKLETLVGLAGELGNELLAAGQAAEAFIEVHTAPGGATISIDGREVGVAGQAYPVEPGKHTIEARLDGHTTVTRELDVTAGETRTDRINLVAMGAAPVDSGDDGIGGVYKWAALGGGVALTALGITWIAVDGPQTESGPGGTELRKPDERNTLVPGIISTTLGAGLLGLSGYLFYREMGAESSTRAALTPTRGGAMVGFSGRF